MLPMQHERPIKSKWRQNEISVTSCCLDMEEKLFQLHDVTYASFT